MWTGEQNFACDGKIFYGTLWQPVATFMLINILQGVLLGNTVKVSADHLTISGHNGEIPIDEGSLLLWRLPASQLDCLADSDGHQRPGNAAIQGK